MKFGLLPTRRRSSIELPGGMMSEQALHPTRRIMTVSEHFERLANKLGLWKPLSMADGMFYNDLRSPFISADVTAVTLATTNKALYPIANFPALGSNYFSFIGKAVRIRLFGIITTALTPGNGQFAVYWGTGADANGTIVASSAAFALSASQTNLSWTAEFDIHCRALGSSGSLFGTGEAGFNVGVVASTLQPIMIPASAPAAVTVDLTANNILSVQFNRSGSTAETMQVKNMQVIALN